MMIIIVYHEIHGRGIAPGGRRARCHSAQVYEGEDMLLDSFTHLSGCLEKLLFFPFATISVSGSLDVLLQPYTQPPPTRGQHPSQASHP